MKKWTDKVDNTLTDAPETILLNYLLQPQIVPSRYYKDGAGNELPVYKTNEHLGKVLLNWAIENGRKEFAKRLVTDIEWYAAGNTKEPDVSSFDRSLTDAYDFSSLGPLANSARTMARHIGVFWADPVLNARLEGVIKTARPRIRVIEGPEGEKIPVRNENARAQRGVGQYSKSKRGVDGEGC